MKSKKIKVGDLVFVDSKGSELSIGGNRISDQFGFVVKIENPFFKIYLQNEMCVFPLISTEFEKIK